MARFDPQSYSEFRIGYPSFLFDGIRPLWSQWRKQSDALRVLDIGAGTGISAKSFLQTFPDAHMRLIEPDEGMRARIPITLGESFSNVCLESSSAETIEVRPSAHAILIGSAWHWMDREIVTRKMIDVLEPGGFIYIFEYQFPKAVGEGALELNEWIRRKFNTVWKPATQAPRGSLQELTQVLRDHRDLNERQRREWKHEVSLSVDELIGVIRSQSRYLAYEKTRGPHVHDDWEVGLKKEWGAAHLRSFAYLFESFLFCKRR